MSKTLKIFLYSLVGALVGVIGFGAISSVTREEKKEEKAPTETTYDISVGETVVGNWYRFYKNSKMMIDTMEMDGHEIGYMACSCNQEGCIGWDTLSMMGAVACLAGNVPEKYIEIPNGGAIGETEYIDIYIAEGKEYNNYEALDETSTIKSFEGKILRVEKAV